MTVFPRRGFVGLARACRDARKKDHKDVKDTRDASLSAVLGVLGVFAVLLTTGSRSRSRARASPSREEIAGGVDEGPDALQRLVRLAPFVPDGIRVVAARAELLRQLDLEAPLHEVQPQVDAV